MCLTRQGKAWLAESLGLRRAASLRLLTLAVVLVSQAGGRAQTLYSIGEPSNEAQLYLELIKRSRADPASEGVRLAHLSDVSALSEYYWWPVNLTMMQAEFAALQPLPPFAMSAELSAAAEAHSADMLAVGFQGHVGSNGSGLGDRINAAGYSGWVSAGENVYSYAETVIHGHASFQVDWGPGTGWMQTGRPHRANIHDAQYTEVGIGLVSGVNGRYGPAFVTQDFGLRPAMRTFITGVVYYDVDGDGAYDINEGIGGVDVQVAGIAHYAITSASGGYAVPVASDGTYSVTFSLAGMTPEVRNVTIAGSKNVKLDWTPPYPGTAIVGASVVPAGTNQNFSISPVPGAESYEVKVAKLDTSPAGEGAENGTSSLSIYSTGGYAVLQSTIRHSGSRAFHLAHSSSLSPDQTVTLTRVFVPGPSGQLRFWSRLRAADSAQWAMVEISRDGGVNWEQVLRQRGSGGTGEGGFYLRTVPLDRFAGEHILIRFNYASTTGYYYAGTGSQYGWFFDDISFSDVSELTDSSLTEDIGKLSPSFDYVAPATGGEQLFVRAVTRGGSLPWSAGHEVTAGANDYMSWAARMESAAGLPGGALSDPNGDFDGDRIPHAVEYALEEHGLDPASGVARGYPRPVQDDGYLVLDYVVDTSKSDLAVGVQASTDLTSWHAPGDAGKPAGFEVNVISNGAGSLQTMRARVPLADGASFLRFVVTLAETR